MINSTSTTDARHPDARRPDARRPDARQPLDPHDPRHLDRVKRAIAGRSFAVLSTVSPAGFPHAAGVVYAAVGTELYLSTMHASRKAINIASNDRVAVVVPVRRVPVGPPFTVQFQGRATVLASDDHEVLRLSADGRLKAITGHGELDDPDGCIVRITPTGTIHTYGLGVPVLAVARDPLHRGPRSVRLS